MVTRTGEGSSSNNDGVATKTSSTDALLQTPLSLLLLLVQFVNCWQFFLELNSKRLYRGSGREKKVVALCSRPPQNVKLGIFTS